MGKTHWNGSSRRWMGGSTNLGMPVCGASAGSSPVRVRGRHQNGWKEVQSSTHVAVDPEISVSVLDEQKTSSLRGSC